MLQCRDTLPLFLLTEEWIVGLDRRGQELYANLEVRNSRKGP